MRQLLQSATFITNDIKLTQIRIVYKMSLSIILIFKYFQFLFAAIFLKHSVTMIAIRTLKIGNGRKSKHIEKNTANKQW